MNRKFVKFISMSFVSIMLSSFGGNVLASNEPLEVSNESLNSNNEYNNNSVVNSESNLSEYDKYVSISDDGLFYLNEESYVLADEIKIIISEKINLTNANIISSKNNSFSAVNSEDKFVEVFDNSRSARANGVNSVRVYWWGIQVKISRNSIRRVGNGLSIGAFWIPKPVIQRVVGSLGVGLSTCPHGIWFETRPVLNVTSILRFGFQ